MLQNYSCTYFLYIYFLPCIAITTAAFLKRDCSYRFNYGIRLQQGDEEHNLMKEKKVDVHIFVFPFLCSGIPDLALGILKMVIRVCFRDVSQPAVY